MNARRLGLALSLLLLPMACDPPPQPVANAGAAQMVAVRQVVQLDGSASSTKITEAGAQLSRFAWSFMSVPSGSAAQLNHDDIPKPSFTPDLVGDYMLKLTVYDANGSASAMVTITAVDCLPKIDPIVAMPAVPNVGDDVTLSTTVAKGTGCDDRAPYTWAWSVVSIPAGSHAALAPTTTGGGSTAAAPVFHVDMAGDYNFSLRITDAAGRWSVVTAKVTAGNCGNNAPSVTTISASPAMPNTGDVVQLSAAISDADTDPMGTCKRTQSVSYRWTLLTAPQGSSATLSAADSAVPWLRPDSNGTYTLRLVVTDSTGLASAAKDFPLTVADCGSKLPVVNSITPSTVSPILGQQVAITANVTDDNMLQPCNKLETFTYAWTLISQPAQSIAKLSGANTATPTFVADAAGPYKLQLTVTDSDGHVSAPMQSPAIVASTCGASAPVAQIGILAPLPVTAPVAAPPQVAVQAPLNVALQLDASTSSDPDNAKMCALQSPQTLIYTWRFEMLPQGSRAVINDAHATTPSFTPDVAGAYVVDLFVTDNTGLTSTAARVQVNGFNPQPTVAWGVGPYTSLVLDGTDPRIAFYDKARGGAFIATCTGPSCATNPIWSITPIDMSNATMGRMISLATNAGNLYATYWDAANCAATYAVSTNGGKTWNTSLIQAPFSLQAANGCQPDNSVVCQNGGGGGGQQNQIDPRDNGAFPTIAISPNTGNPMVAFVGYVAGGVLVCVNRFGQNTNYYDAGYDEVRTAVCTANCTSKTPTWAFKSAAIGSNANNSRIGYTSLTYDPTTKRPSIAFRSNSYAGNGVNGVGYVSCTANCDTNPTWTAPAWIDTDRGFDAYNTGTNAGAESTTTSVAISSTGQPSIAYYDGRNQWLRLASCAASCNNAGNWGGIVVDASGQVGQYASLALSPLQATLDRPRISYLNGTGGTLRFAQQAGDGSWALTDLDKSNGYTSLKLTPTDGVRLSHYTTTAVRFYTSGN